MRTPSLRVRITVISTLVLVLVLLAMDAFLYLTLRAHLESALDEVPLPGGGTVTVYASRAGVDRTLRRLLVLELAGTAAVAGLAVVLLGRMAAAYGRMLDALEAALDRSRRSDERNRRFLADAAHQLRTPITRIRTTVESLFRAESPEVRDRLLTTLVRETGRTRRLLSALLRIARLDEGDPPARSPVDLADLCRTEMERAAPFAPHLRFEFSAPGAPAGPLDVDGESLREAVSNLLDNARRHATRTVQVNVETVTDVLRIEVADDGPGVRANDRELIFERFVSLDDKGGSGLGLPIARGVARAHGGDLVYTGTAFVLTVPLSPGSSGPPRDTASRSAST